MAAVDAQNPLLGETTCGSLLQQLQQIWDEVGETGEERDKMLLQLEQDRLGVYKRKVDLDAKSRAHQLLTSLLSALGERTFVGIPDKTSGTIKEQLSAIAPALEQLCKQKDQRIKEFSDVQSQVQTICREIAGTSEQVGSPAVDEFDLSLKKLDEFNAQLQQLQKEKSERLHKVLEFVSTVHDLCAVLRIDFFITVTEVHPSLNDSTGVQSKSISNETLSCLAKTVSALEEDKEQRLHKDQKKFHEQLSTEQETNFGSRPSPARPLSTKKVLGPRANGAPNRRLSLNTHQNGTQSINKDGKRDNTTRPVSPLNYVAISQEDAASCISGTEPLRSTPW